MLNFHQLPNFYQVSSYLPVIIIFGAFLLFKPYILPMLSRIFYKTTLMAFVSLSKKDSQAFLDYSFTTAISSKEKVLNEMQHIKSVKKIFLPQTEKSFTNKIQILNFEAEVMAEDGSTKRYKFAMERDMSALTQAYKNTPNTSPGRRPQLYKISLFQRMS